MHRGTEMHIQSDVGIEELVAQVALPRSIVKSMSMSM